MKKIIGYIPSYDRLTDIEIKRIKHYKGHETILELYELNIINKTELFLALELLYS